MMIQSTIAMAVAVLAELLPRWAGLAMVACIVVYLIYWYKAS